jgi:streptomycin 6-kinase
MTLPAAFQDTIKKVHGPTGELWLQNFDQLLIYCENKWGLELSKPYNPTYNFVAPVILRDKRKAVLKLGVSPKSVHLEASVLHFFKGCNFCKLIDADVDKGILLLEQLDSGAPLSTLKDEALACRAAVKLIYEMQSCRGIYQALYHSVLSRGKELIKLRKHFNGLTGPIAEKFVENAELLFPALAKSIINFQLFHGDFHHFNILSSGNNNWKLIDPKGILSEAAYEIIPFLMNDLEGKNLIKTIQKRVNVFAMDLNISEERILKWGAVHSVISLWWLIEDQLPVKAHNLAVAEAFYELSKENK